MAYPLLQETDAKPRDDSKPIDVGAIGDLQIIDTGSKENIDDAIPRDPDRGGGSLPGSDGISGGGGGSGLKEAPAIPGVHFDCPDE